MYKTCKNPDCKRGLNGQPDGWHDYQRGRGKGAPRQYCCATCAHSAATKRHRAKKRDPMQWHDTNAKAVMQCPVCLRLYIPDRMFTLNEDTGEYFNDSRPFCSTLCQVWQYPQNEDLGDPVFKALAHSNNIAAQRHYELRTEKPWQWAQPSTLKGPWDSEALHKAKQAFPSMQWEDYTKVINADI